MIAQEEHERLPEPCIDDAPMRRAIDVDSCPATETFVAELCRHGSAEGVTEYSHARQVESSTELSR